MTADAVMDSGINVFHSLASIGQQKLALKTLSTLPKKSVASGLVAKDENGRTPLHTAAYCGNIKVLKVFLEAFPEAADIRDSNGNNVRDALRRPLASPIGEPEHQKCFRRLVKFDKVGWEHVEFRHGPMEVWDFAVSSNAVVAVVQPTWSDGGSRMLYGSVKGVLEQFDLGAENIPRYVATSNVHSLVLTGERCFAWGKNVNGVLGIDTDEKLVLTPTAIEMTFSSSSKTEKMTGFSALGTASDSRTECKDPLIGVDCCDFHSLCYTTTKVWSWGVNRGQMTNKSARLNIEEMPVLVYQSTTRIRSVKCCDDAIVILLSNGQVQVLYQDRVIRLQAGKLPEVESLAAKGDYIILQTKTGKILRLFLKSIQMGKEDYTVLWTPRRKKDEVRSFDVSSNGIAIIASKSSVFKVGEAKELTELKSLRGVPFTSVKTDPQFREYVGVTSVVAGLDYSPLQHSAQNKYGEKYEYVRWERSEEIENRGEKINIKVDCKELPVHSSLLYGRCPALRSLIVEKTPKSVSVPGGSAVFRQCEDSTYTLIVEHTPVASVEAFVESLYYARDAPMPDFSSNLPSGLMSHEYHALRRLVTYDLGIGLWYAKLAGVGCDVQFASGQWAHAAILATSSPVLAAQLSRWPNTILEDPALSSVTIDDVLRYVYTMELPVFNELQSKVEIAQRLFNLWQVADELLMGSLSEECERRLFDLVDFELVLPFVVAMSNSLGTSSSKLYASLIDIIVRNLSFFIAYLSDIDSETLDSVERSYKATNGTEAPNEGVLLAFEKLKLQFTSSLNTSKKSKKKREGSFSGQPFPSLGTKVPDDRRPSTDGKASSTPDLVSPPSSSSSTSKNPAPKSLAPTSPAPSNSSSASSSSATPNKSDGWIRPGRKLRSSPSIAAATPEAARPAANTPPWAANGMLSSSTSSSSSVSASSSPRSLTPQMPSLISRATSLEAKSDTPLRSRHSLTTPNSSTSLAAEVSPSPSSESNTSLTNIGSLPKLGETLPQLGSKARTGSGTKSPRPRFSKKENKKIQQYNDPLVFAEAFKPSTDHTQVSGNPWKRVPKVVQTSESVLKTLERAQQINDRKLAGKNVWGV